jgi:hypothetical protein
VKVLCYFWHMKIKKIAAFLLLSGVLFTVSCDNDIDLTAPYEEIGVIYGILDPSDSIHNVRIQKAFLGEGNALVMAQVTDSLYYPDILDVRLHQIRNGVEITSFPLTRYIGPPKEPGDFPTTPNILYKTNGEVLARDSEYKIIVRNTQTGHIFQSSTPIVDSISVLRPTQNEKIKWANTNPVIVEYVPTPEGKVYNLTIRFHFGEEEVGTGIVEQKSIDWVFPNEILINPNSVSTIRKEIAGENFYKFVDTKLQPGISIRRYAGKLDFIITAGAEFLANYIAINQSTTSILTTAPYYSNVDGGTGIFSSRYMQVTKDKEMDIPALDLLKTSPYTSDLGFQ